MTCDNRKGVGVKGQATLGGETGMLKKVNGISLLTYALAVGHTDSAWTGGGPCAE